jgi:hypothetical protein
LCSLVKCGGLVGSCQVWCCNCSLERNELEVLYRMAVHLSWADLLAPFTDFTWRHLTSLYASAQHVEHVFFETHMHMHIQYATCSTRAIRETKTTTIFFFFFPVCTLTSGTISPLRHFHSVQQQPGSCVYP